MHWNIKFIFFIEASPHLVPSLKSWFIKDEGKWTTKKIMEAWQKHGNHNNVYWIGLKPYIQRKPTKVKKFNKEKEMTKNR